MYFGLILGTFAGKIMGFRKKIMVENIKRAFGENISKKEIDKLITKVWQHAVISSFEFIKLPYISKEKLKSLVSIENENSLKEIDPKNGIIGVTGHLGNWEFMGAYFSSFDYKMKALVKFIHNQYVDKFVNTRRKRLGYSPIYIHEGMKKIITSLNEGNVVVFVADQDAGSHGIFVDFFNTPASTFTGPAYFHIKTKKPILPVFDIRVSLTKHKIVFAPPIIAPENLSNNEKIFYLTQTYTKILEDIVRKYPEQYFWFHRRWKTKPKQSKK